MSLIVETREEPRYEGIFYYMLALVLYIALIRVIFYKYVSTMFTLFFKATLRQQQLREQLLQSPLPGLLLNVFFVISTSTYFAFLSRYYQFRFAENFWSTLAYAVIIVALIYTVKFILLHVAGWIFGIRSVIESYIFAVFLINKMIGIFLLPLLMLMAFPNALLLPAVVTISYILLGGMLLYRFIISYRPLRNEIKLTRFIFLCTFAPSK